MDNHREIGTRGKSSSQEHYEHGTLQRFQRTDVDDQRTLSLGLHSPGTSSNHQQQLPLKPPSPPPSQPPSDPFQPPDQFMQRPLIIQQQLQQPPSNTLPTPSVEAMASLAIAYSNPQADAPVEQNAGEAEGQHGSQPRKRKYPTRGVGQGKSETIVPPYPWARDRRATVHSRKYLMDEGITTITGQVQCKKCEKMYDIEYDIVNAFERVAAFAWSNQLTMHHRAPKEWMNPRLPQCKYCGLENRVKPVILKKRGINWLFLLLGQMLGCCSMDHLKYFCKHTKKHRTGAKNRLLYTTYFELLRQLEPEGPSAA
ncbi:hypothetical protein Ancab_027456 [Ancistrocladus abbreviatus]